MSPTPQAVVTPSTPSYSTSAATIVPSTVVNQSALLPPSQGTKDGRSLSSTGMFPPRGQSLAVSGPPPGSFSSQLTSTSRSQTPRPDFPVSASYLDEDDMRTESERRQADIRGQIEKETKIKMGSENMLEALNASKYAKNLKEQRSKAEAELNSSNRKIAELRQMLHVEMERSKEEQELEDRRISFMPRGSGRPTSEQTFSADGYDVSEDEESPTYVLSELLQGLENDGMPPEYYVDIANRLVDLFKRNPNLKYDLAWTDFGLRLQTMLLSESREVIAAGYRLMRHSITDRRSLRIMRSLHTDYFVLLSLVKDSKATVEREQALKFVRAFLDVKEGVQELSRSVIRVIVAVADHNDDRLRNISILTLSEILVLDPARLVEAGGLGALADALGDPNFRASRSLVASFLFMLDYPSRRKYLRSGHEIEAPIAILTESPVNHAHEEKLKASAKVILALLRSWQGLFTLSMNNFVAIRSIIASFYIPIIHVRTVLLELIVEVLRISPPSWSGSFLAGRRLTTYNRVTNPKSDLPTSDSNEPDEEADSRSLLEHFTAITLAVLLHCGLVDALIHCENESLNEALKRRTSLVLSEVLKLANEVLPSQWSARLQILPNVVQMAAMFTLDPARLPKDWATKPKSVQKLAHKAARTNFVPHATVDDRFVALHTIYQVDSVNRTLYRFDAANASSLKRSSSVEEEHVRQAEQSKTQQALQINESTFRQMQIDTQVLMTVKFSQWKWDQIQIIIDGPLRNPKRLDEAINTTKFLHRLLRFYSPFKFRYSEIRNTKPNQRYTRVGCALLGVLLQHDQGARYLSDSKMVRQIGECLAQHDKDSGITSDQPIFSTQHMEDTLSGGYFQLLGAMSKSALGLQILEKWRIFNIFYHIIKLEDRDDLIMALLSGMDYTLDSHLRILLSNAMTTCSKDIRIFATRILRKYATKAIVETAQATDAPSSTNQITNSVVWAIKLLVTQLYDPAIEVADEAIKILKEACKHRQSLEYIVRCRPALDHLGSIGQPLLLRFLSTSAGYQYLDELDYIKPAMDDWFLGRNEEYVGHIETNLAKALQDFPTNGKQPTVPSVSGFEDLMPDEEDGVVPPHFYRELTRTKEGCRLLQEKGHFDEFVETIHECGFEAEDHETIVKVKGCLWAVGNVGSMELGAPFLENTRVVRYIVDIAERSEVMSVRGTAFFVLGLISRSLHGQEILCEYGWDGAYNMRGDSLGYCIPLDISRIFSVRATIPLQYESGPLTTDDQMKPWSSPSEFHLPYGMPSTHSNNQRERSMTAATKSSLASGSTADDDPVTLKILRLISDLVNTVLAKKAASELNGIKARKPPQFQSPALFRRVLALLEQHKYQLPVRRFVMDLFDKEVLRTIVMEESDEEDDTGEHDFGRLSGLTIELAPLTLRSGRLACLSRRGSHGSRTSSEEGPDSPFWRRGRRVSSESQESHERG